jgi:hypothetical protein
MADDGRRMTMTDEMTGNRGRIPAGEWRVVEFFSIIRHLSSVICSSAIRHLPSVIPLCSSLLFLSAPLAAQSVRGIVRNEVSHTIVADALVQLLGDRERVVVSGTSSARGEYVLRAPAEGVYRLRVLRIGYRPWVSDTVRLVADRIQVKDLDVDAGVVVLKELTVTARSSCKRSPSMDARMDAVWQQARTMLGLIDAGASGDLEFRVLTRDRTLDQWERPLGRGTSRMSRGTGAWPVTSLPADSLAQYGFIQAGDPEGGPIYYGPDVAVFFSDAFLGSHCFRLLPAPKGEAELIGLSFEPLPGRKVADIEGVLWVHQRDGLTRLEYSYAPTPEWLRKGKAGGVLRFDRVSTGRPIITEWSIQAPIPRIEQYRVVVHGFKQTIGEVEEVRSGEAVLWRRAAT